MCKEQWETKTIRIRVPEEITNQTHTGTDAPHTHTHANTDTHAQAAACKASWCLGGRQALETATVKIKFHLSLIPFTNSAESHCYCDSRANLSQLLHCGNQWRNRIACK